jgi:hypothetical protein
MDCFNPENETAAIGRRLHFDVTLRRSHRSLLAPGNTERFLFIRHILNNHRWAHVLSAYFALSASPPPSVNHEIS